MADATLRIKNLSIALEALSRIACDDGFHHFTRIQELIDKEIKEFREEKEKETQWPRQRPATPPTRPKGPFSNLSADDDIPF